MITALIVVGILILSVFYNYVCAVCIKYISDGQPLRAAIADSALFLMGSLSLASLVFIGWWTLIPELVGGFVGTYYGAKRAPGNLRRVCQHD